MSAKPYILIALFAILGGALAAWVSSDDSKPARKYSLAAGAPDSVLSFKLKLKGRQGAIQNYSMTLACRNGSAVKGSKGFNFDIAMQADKACRLVGTLPDGDNGCPSLTGDNYQAGEGAVIGTIKNSAFRACYQDVIGPGCLPSQRAWRDFSRLWLLEGPADRQQAAAAKLVHRRQIEESRKLQSERERASRAAAQLLLERQRQQRKFLAPGVKIN